MSKAPLTRQSYPQDKQENNFVFAGIFRPSPFATSLYPCFAYNLKRYV